MSKPNYKKAAIELSKILKAAEKRRGISSKSSETTQGIKDVTEESSETAYQFTDFDLTVFKNEDVEDDSDENPLYGLWEFDQLYTISGYDSLGLVSVDEPIWYLEISENNYK